MLAASCTRSTRGGGATHPNPNPNPDPDPNPNQVAPRAPALPRPREPRGARRTPRLTPPPRRATPPPHRARGAAAQGHREGKGQPLQSALGHPSLVARPVEARANARGAHALSMGEYSRGGRATLMWPAWLQPVTRVFTPLRVLSAHSSPAPRMGETRRFRRLWVCPLIPPRHLGWRGAAERGTGCAGPRPSLSVGWPRGLASSCTSYWRN